MKIVNTNQMRSLEQRSLEFNISTDTLMENAGLAAAQICKEVVSKTPYSKTDNILILAGSGNNGGDAIVAGRILSDWNYNVTIYNCSRSGRVHEKASTLSNSSILVNSKSDPNFDLLLNLVSKASIIVDGIIGTGITGNISGKLKLMLKILETAQKSNQELTVVALDVPTGIDADTGNVHSSKVTADITIAFGYPKIANYTMPGAKHCGSVSVADIGMPEGIDEEIETALLTDELIIPKLPKRPLDAHKGTFGKVLFIGGCQRYKGASYLATRASARTGAGLVTAAIPPSIQIGLSEKVPEITYLMVAETTDGYIDAGADKQVMEAIENFNTVLIGCGMGITDSTISLIYSLLLSNAQLPSPVIDADALTILSKRPDWYLKFDQLAILTPHIGEMSRLIGSNLSIHKNISTEKLITYANKWNKIIVMKGPYTRVVSPDGLVFISPMANPGLASAGTGDVLAGTIAGLLAQGLNMTNAAVTGVYIHSLAGQRVKNMMGDTGMLASDILNELPLTIANLKGLNV